MVTPHLHDADRARIAAAVAAAETRTSVELRLVFAHSSSHYASFELIYPAGLALIAGGIIAALYPILGAGFLFMIEGALFAVGLLLLQWRTLRHALVPAAIKRKAAWRNARLSYANIGLQNLPTRNALLLFCSAAERYVEILVDDEVHEALPETIWAPIVARFTAQFAAGTVADAFAEAAKSCADALAEKFPRRPGAPDTLPDALIEI